MTVDPDRPPTAQRKRKTKAERDAERIAEAQANAEKPVDPLIWILLGGAVLFVAVMTWLDPATMSEAGSASNQSFLRLIPVFLIGIFGKTTAVIILTILGGVPLVWGIIGWLRRRFGSKTP